MASRTSRREWIRGLPSAFGVGRQDRKRFHSASERSVGYVFLIRKSVQSHPNPHPYQTGSEILVLRDLRGSICHGGALGSSDTSSIVCRFRAYSPKCLEGAFSE